MRAPYTESGYACSPIASRAANPSSDRPTVATVDLNALTHNYQEMARRIGDRKVLAVVKAQAYGHGAIPVSRRLVELGIHMLGVALVEEGRDLRDAGITAPILVMAPVFPEQAEVIVSAKLTPVVYTLAVARALSDAVAGTGTTLGVHVKIDTGMGRIGLSPEEAVDFIVAAGKLPGLAVQGLMTHFADADLRDKAFAYAQMDRFESLIRSLEARAITIPLSYGRTFITTRESLIATIPLGYADGYSRGLSNKGEAIVRGVRVPVAGRVCMDMTMLDVTDVPGVAEGDEVVLIGAQGNERITADDIAAKTGTIAYEVLCGISSRVPRVIK
jgi:alanine racemase